MVLQLTFAGGAGTVAQAVGLDPSSKVNLADARVLLLDDNPRSLRILASVLTGFGVRNLHRCTSTGDAQRVLTERPVDLVIADCELPDADGFDFVHWLRRSGLEDNAFIPVIMLSGHTPASKVKKARDSGANFIVAKPITPNVLLERLFWVARDPRPFVEAGRYLGPDRRHKEIEPPKNARDRRRKRAEAPPSEQAA